MVLQLELAVAQACRAADRRKIDQLERDLAILRESLRDLHARIERVANRVVQLQTSSEIFRSIPKFTSSCSHRKPIYSHLCISAHITP